MKKKILITGSSGHSGNQIARLLKEDYQIIGLDLHPGTYTSHLGSVNNTALINRILKGASGVIHTASLHAPHVKDKSRQEFIDVNISGTLNLLNACVKNGIEKLVYTSTTSIYGKSLEDKIKAVWVTEDLPTYPRDIYDITKIAAENLCRDFFNQDGLNTVSLRVSRFWNEPLDRKVFYRMYRGLDVRDVAEAHKLALEKDFSQYEVFNISSSPIFKQEDLYELKNGAPEYLKHHIPELIEHFTRMGWDIPTSIDRVYVIDKAKELLGYQPKFNIHELLLELRNNIEMV